MISNNVLSEKLCKLACQLDKISSGEFTASEGRRILVLVAGELHDLSNEKFVPEAVTTWADIKPKNDTKKTYKSKTGRDLPF